VVAQSRQTIFQRTGEPGDDHVESPFSFDKVEDFVIEERSIGTHANRPARLGQFGKGSLQQRDGDGRGLHIARLVAALPTILAPSFETQQRKVRWTPAFLGVVAHLGSLLMAVDRQHRAVQIEDGPRRSSHHRRSPRVVQSDQGISSSASQPQQEASQAGGLGIARQARQGMKHTVVAQRFGRLDASQTQDEWIKQRFQRLADTVAVVSLGKVHLARKGAPHANLLKKFPDQRDATELGQTHTVGNDAQFSRSSGHCYQTSLLVMFHCNGQNSPRRPD